MKTPILAGVMALTLVFGGALLSVAFASPDYGQRGDDEMRSERMEHRGERRMERMFEILDLSDSQEDQIEAIHAAARERDEPYREQLKASRERIRQLCEAETVDREAIRSEVAAQVDAKTALIVSRANVRNETFNLLTPEQQELAEKIGPRMGHRKHGWD